MKYPLLLVAATCASISAHAASPVRVVVQPSKVRQPYQGIGCGAMFYEGHITSLAARGKDDRQRQLYDDMFAKVNTRFLHLMIRATHEPQNDNDDPWTPAFDPANFKYCEHTLAIAKAAKERRPDIELLATMLTPPPWLKTNNDESGKGKATLKPKLELEYAEYLWAFLAHMARHGCPVKYLAISNECDWDHTQPGCFFEPDAHAKLFGIVGDYLDKMAVKFPDVPRALLVGPNTLSAPNAVKNYIPAMQRTAGKHLAVLAAHDYDMRGDRWGDLQKLARGRPVWMTEWCSRGEDDSTGQIKAAIDYGTAMHEAFSGGANVWMAYDWVYPKRNAGESLIHVDWGNDYTLKKPYWVFRQWSAALRPGMRVVECGSSQAAVKATAFVSADRHLIVHVLNTADAESPVQLNIGGSAALTNRERTSTSEDAATLPALPPGAGGYADALPARSLTTYRFQLR
ncbi:MAG: glycoside hydrolase family 30 beta sandwich domain-containing protein [Chthoniobacteraceae bacterium]